MPARPRHRSVPWAVLFLTAGSVGCAAVAHQPQTPARQVGFEDLNDPSPPGERYFLLVFGSQTKPIQPRYTHTWVTFVRVPTGASTVEQHTISWMPATLNIRTFHPCAEPGVNLSMDETMAMALGYGERVSLWGPYEIPPGLYRKLLMQKQFVESGALKYQCIDTYGEAGWSGDGSNCIHAISDGDAMFSRQAYPLAYFGDSASLHILRQLVMRGAVPDPVTTYDELIPRLGLDHYPICRRAYEPPRFPNAMRFGQALSATGRGGP